MRDDDYSIDAASRAVAHGDRLIERLARTGSPS